LASFLVVFQPNSAGNWRALAGVWLEFWLVLAIFHPNLSGQVVEFDKHACQHVVKTVSDFSKSCFECYKSCLEAVCMNFKL